MKKTSLLDLLCMRDHALTRKDHYSRILCGEIYVEGQCVRDPQARVESKACIEYRQRRRFVSRGGEKLAGIVDQWRIIVRGLSFLDAGASTGGFTDCLLQFGASRVIAVEAGVNQLDYRLRGDSRVSLLENTNIMDLHSLPFTPEAAVADLSLRSLRRAASHILDLVSRQWLIALIKPQYEWRDPPVDFHGVVSADPSLTGILRELLEDLRKEGVQVRNLAEARPLGKRGNREFFCLLTTGKAGGKKDLDGLIRGAVEQPYSK